MRLKKVINTSDATAPIGPYSQAVHTGNLLFMSGQVAINPKTGELVMDTIEAETKQVMENLRNLLIPVAGSFDDVVMAGPVPAIHALSSRSIVYPPHGRA